MTAELRDLLVLAGGGGGEVWVLVLARLTGLPIPIGNLHNM